MKVCNQFLIFIILGGYSCKNVNTASYPEIVVKNNKQQQYNLARAEMYKISTGLDCACKAVTYYNSKGESSNDTLHVISLEIKLDTMHFKADTVIYLFSFYAYKKDNMAYTINDLHDNCPQYYGVEYLNDASIPFRYLIAESSYIDRESITNLNLIDSSFNVYVSKNKKNANKWLIDYLHIK